MKRIVSIFCITLSVCTIAFSQTVSFSGNVDVGLKADFTAGSSAVYAFSDNAGFPLQINQRVDFALDDKAGLTVNFRTRGTGQSLGTSNRGIPYLNRGLVWMKLFNGLVKVRTGYLWDTDYESSWNAWDTGSVLEWCTAVDFFPVKGLQIGFVVPTPLASVGALDAVTMLKNTTFGINWTPSFMRVSVMGEYGANDADRSVNFGIDLTAIKGLTARIEGDLQQVGIDGVGYYQLFQQFGYALGPISPDVQFTETISKVAGVPMAVTILPNVTAKVDVFTIYGQYKLNFTADDLAAMNHQVKLSVKAPLTAKSWVAVGSYVTMNAGSDPVISPYFNLFAGY